MKIVSGQVVLDLREKRVIFTQLLARLIEWTSVHPGWELAFGEGLVAQTDAADGDHDGPHRRGGAHYTGLGHDMVLYINGEWIKDGGHPVWTMIGVKWESYHELCRWGGRFVPNDANHFSVFHEGRA